MCEAGVKDKVAIKNVIYVILNRVNSELYSNTIEGVIMEKRQFSPVASGKYAEARPTEEMLSIAEEAYNDYSSTNNAQGALNFKAVWCDVDWSNKTYLFTDGKHDFYK